jgi:hypothetical protein
MGSRARPSSSWSVNARRDAYNCASRVNAGFTLGCQIAARGTSRTLISYVQHRLNRLRAEQVDYLPQQAGAG